MALPKWTGRLRATALAMVNCTCDCPHLGTLAVSCCVHAHRLVVTPRVWGLHLLPRAGTSSMCSPCSDASVLACRRRLDFVLALSWQHLRWRLVRMLAFLWQSLEIAFGHALHQGHQRVRLGGHGSLSLASGFDAGGTLAPGP